MNLKRTVPFIAAVGLVAIAMANDLANFKKWYMGEAPTMIKAMESKNMAYFEKISTKDFTYKESSGRVADKKTSIGGMKQMMEMAQTVKFKAKIGAFKSTAKGMTVDVDNHFDITMKPGPDKKVHKMVMDTKSVETWVKVNGKWMLKNITDKSSKMTMDGKPMSAGG